MHIVSEWESELLPKLILKLLIKNPIAAMVYIAITFIRYIKTGKWKAIPRKSDLMNAGWCVLLLRWVVPGSPIARRYIENAFI